MLRLLFFSVHDFYRSDAITADKCRRNLLAAFSKRCRGKFPLKSIELFFNCSNRAQLQMRKVPRRHAGHRLSSSPLANNSFIGHHAGEIYCFWITPRFVVFCAVFFVREKENSTSHDSARSSGEKISLKTNIKLLFRRHYMKLQNVCRTKNEIDKKSLKSQLVTQHSAVSFMLLSMATFVTGSLVSWQRVVGREWIRLMTRLMHWPLV